MTAEISTIQTLRPDAKRGVMIMRGQYDRLAAFILSAIQSAETITLNEVIERAQNELDAIDSDIAWYILQVKLDLEARGLIKFISPVYQKRVFYIRLTRSGQKKLKELTK